MEEENFLNLENYTIVEKIGKGSFGKVFVVQKKDSSIIFAAKVALEELNDESRELKINLCREVNLMSQLSHPSILKFIGFSPTDFSHKEKTVIFTEYAKNKSLDCVLNLERQGISPKSWNNTKKLINIYGIAAAMSYLHSNNIIHRDLKPQNILEDDQFYPKIADFGLSKITHMNQYSITYQSTSEIKGTPVYIAPEIWETRKYSKECDIYSFSFIIYELITGDKPFKDIDVIQLYSKILHNVRPKFEFPIPNCYRQLIEKCWSINPDDRPSFDKIVSELKSNPEFITDDIDKEEYLDYIDYIENHEKYFDKNKKLIQIDDKFEIIHHRNPDKIVENEKINRNENNLKINEEDIFVDLVETDVFTSLSEEKQNYILNNIYDQQNNQILIKSNDTNLLFKHSYLNSSELIQIFNLFKKVSIEIDYPSDSYDSIYSIVSNLKNEIPIIQITIIINGIEKINFCNNSNINFVRIEKPAIEISENAFRECSKLTEVTIPSSVTEICESSFKGCISLEKVIIEKDSLLTKIGKDSFCKCKSLKVISIPSSVQIIESGAFRKCSLLTQISISSPLAEINESVFHGCESLNQITIPSSVTKIKDKAFQNCKSLKEIIIPSSVTEIGSNLFDSCSSLIEVTIPSSITKIGKYSFSFCTSIEQIKIPSSVITIEDHAFYSCESLKSIEIPSSVTKIEKGLFKRCSSLQDIKLPNSIISIEDGAFYGCTKLTTIEIPPPVTCIGKDTFCTCRSLSNVTIPPFVTSIERDAFSYCKKLCQLTIPSSVTKIGDHAFQHSGLNKIEIPNSVIKIGKEAFKKCSLLKKVTILSSSVNFGVSVFINCDSMEEILAPSPIKISIIKLYLGINPKVKITKV